MKKAILVVSFGTSYEETRKKTIEAIEQRIAEHFKEYRVYRAFTSIIIRKKLLKQGIQVYSVREAIEQILADGMRELIVQPTYIIRGIENDGMMEDVLKYKARFSSLVFGKPLLSDSEDYKEVAFIIHESYPIEKNEAMILMGHGSDHYANAAYPAFENTLKQEGYSNILVGTVEGYPTFEEACTNLKKLGHKKVCLVPMMIVAGNHANNDMAGSEDSWKSKLESQGYQVRCVMSGLGESKKIQNMFVRHIWDACQGHE